MLARWRNVELAAQPVVDNPAMVLLTVKTRFPGRKNAQLFEAYFGGDSAPLMARAATE